jgi:hypothetical protein
MATRINDLMVLGKNISKTDLAKYLRDREAVLPRDFGGLGDGAANDRGPARASWIGSLARRIQRPSRITRSRDDAFFPNTAAA